MKNILLNSLKLLKYQHNTDGIGTFLYNDQLQIVEWSEAMGTFTGVSRNECLGRFVHDVIILKPAPDKQLFESAIQGVSYVVKGASIQKAKGEEAKQVYDLHFCPLEEPDKESKTVLVLTMPTELSRYRIRQNLARTTLTTIEDFFNYAPIPVFIVDANLSIKLANKAFYNLIDVPAESSKNLQDFIPKHLLEPLQRQIRFVIDSEKSLAFSEEYPLEKGVRSLYNVIFPVRNSAGKIDAVGGYLIDLTHQVKQQQQNERLLEETLRLNQVLNDQNKKLEQKQAALDEANKTLQEQKQELERVVSELSDRNYELDQIMYKTSHDLRAPLTSILGLLQLAKQEADVTKLPEYHHYMENRVNKLADFVKTMLTFAKTSRTDLNLEPINWQDLVQESLDQVQFLEHYKEIQIEISINADLYPFLSDPMRMNIILNNLIGNAIKYADLRKSQANVKVQINNSAKGSSIEVVDNGIGISQAYIDKVCDMFVRATDHSEGSGLGLYIVKQTIERLKGTLTIDSREREGTSIAVFLPHLSKQQRLKTMKPKGHSNKKEI